MSLRAAAVHHVPRYDEQPQRAQIPVSEKHILCGAEMSNIAALMVGISCVGPLYYNYNKAPQKE